MNEESWMPWVGSAPQTGALLQYITSGGAAGAGSTYCKFGTRGTVRKPAAGGRPVAGVRRDLATASHEGAEREVELAFALRDSVPCCSSVSRVEPRDVD
jgi:hypothetical protein